MVLAIMRVVDDMEKMNEAGKDMWELHHNPGLSREEKEVVVARFIKRDLIPNDWYLIFRMTNCEELKDVCRQKIVSAKAEKFFPLMDIKLAPPVPA